MCSVQPIFSVLRHILISKASNLVMSFLNAIQGRQSWGLRVATPIFWAGGRREGCRWVVGVVDGSGREILLYLIMYRKYVRKWLLLKRKRIIWPEVALNGNFWLGKSIFSLPEKI